MRIIESVRILENILEIVVMKHTEKSENFFPEYRSFLSTIDDIPELRNFTINKYGLHFKNDTVSFSLKKDKHKYSKSTVWLQLNSEPGVSIIVDRNCVYDTFNLCDDKIEFRYHSSEKCNYDLPSTKDDYFNISLIHDIQTRFTYDEFFELISFYKKYKYLLDKYSLSLELYEI